MPLPIHQHHRDELGVLVGKTGIVLDGDHLVISAHLLAHPRDDDFGFLAQVTTGPTDDLNASHLRIMAPHAHWIRYPTGDRLRTLLR